MMLIDTDYLNKKDTKVLKAQIEQQAKERRMLKADYEERLKADLKAILVELQLEIEEVPKYCMTHDSVCVYRKAEDYISDINKLIQQIIDKLKGGVEE